MSKRRVKPVNPPTDFTTVRVRFSGAGKVYTYRVKKSAGLKPGELCVVESPFQGPVLVFVVAVDKSPTEPEGWSFGNLKWITGKVVEL